VSRTFALDGRSFRSFIAAPLIAGAVAFCLFFIVGSTPPIRAAALAAVIAVMAAALRQHGTFFAIIGALLLAISPAYGSQTGGLPGNYQPLLVIGIPALAAVIGVGVWRFTRDLAWSAGAAAALVWVAVLAGQWIGVSDARSLRVTTLVAASLLALLSDMLYAATPRPDTPPNARVHPHHYVFLIAAFAVGVLNDPLISLFAPALVLGVALTRVRLPPAFWITILALTLFGGVRLVALYVDPFYIALPAERAIAENIQAPYLIADAWRYGQRWIDLLAFIVNQFTPFGAALGVLGLARLSRWYPPLGVVTLLAFASYALFGLLYFGGDAAVLLLPLLMIQAIWLTAALAALRDWLLKIIRKPSL